MPRRGMYIHALCLLGSENCCGASPHGYRVPWMRIPPAPLWVYTHAGVVKRTARPMCSNRFCTATCDGINGRCLVHNEQTIVTRVGGSLKTTVKKLMTMGGPRAFHTIMVASGNYRTSKMATLQQPHPPPPRLKTLVHYPSMSTPV